MTCERKLVRFWDERQLSLLLMYNPCTAAATLPAAIMDGGLAMKLTSENNKRTMVGTQEILKISHQKVSGPKSKRNKMGNTG